MSGLKFHLFLSSSTIFLELIEFQKVIGNYKQGRVELPAAPKNSFVGAVYVLTRP